MLGRLGIAGRRTVKKKKKKKKKQNWEEQEQKQEQELDWLLKPKKKEEEEKDEKKKKEEEEDPGEEEEEEEEELSFGRRTITITRRRLSRKKFSLASSAGSRSYLCAREGPYALQPVSRSQEFPQCCHWNSSNVGMIDDGP